MAERRAQTLRQLSGPCGVVELARKLGWRTSAVIALLRDMEAEGLIRFIKSQAHGKGRPRKTAIRSSLGEEFLADFRKLRCRALHARKTDLQRAVRDGAYVERLVKAGSSPYQLFSELNDLVHNVRGAQETRSGP